ncbi:UNVERIFIED_CONTAM: hypothetical protein HDU68_009845, partial [Siphonaria sp. JEL0065]
MPPSAEEAAADSLNQLQLLQLQQLQQLVPTEITQQIILNLPIDYHLQQVGFMAINPNLNQLYLIHKVVIPGQSGILKACLDSIKYDAVLMKSLKRIWLLIHAVNKNNLAIVKELMRMDVFDPALDGSVLLEWACGVDSPVCFFVVDGLLLDPRFNVAPGVTASSLRLASGKGDLAIVRRLIYDARFHENSNVALCQALKEDKADVAWIFLNRKEWVPSDYVLEAAVENGHRDVVERCLKDGLLDPSTNNNRLIHTAAFALHSQVVCVLLGDCRVDPSVNNNIVIQKMVEMGDAEA